MHLSPEFGLTFKAIENDGFRIDAKVETLVSSDTPVGTAKSLGLGVIGFADALDKLAPDIVIVLGDRYEILAAAQAALCLRIPLAHIGGGDTTEGAIDEAIRHSITKMAHYHFVTHREAARRVIQMGEDPSRVFLVGSLGLDAIRSVPLLSREELENRLAFKFRERNLLVTFHPVTLAPDLGVGQFEQLNLALHKMGEGFGIVFTRPNADPAGRALIHHLDTFVAKHPNSCVYTSMGQELYYSTISQVDVVVGNSSSGLYEVPSFHKPTVNIGERQCGRLAAGSVIHCVAQADAIIDAVEQAFAMECTATVNPYGDGHSAERIISVLGRALNRGELLQKRFVMGDVPWHIR